MCITHRNFNIRVPQNSLKHKNISAVHHEVRRKGVAQNMRHLPSRCLDTSALHGLSKG